MSKPTSKVIQITSRDGQHIKTFLALCEDGSIWQCLEGSPLAESGWICILEAPNKLVGENDN